MTKTVEDAWLTYAEGQRYCSLGRTKLSELVTTGEVEAAKIGRAVRISRRSLDDYMKRNRYVAVGKWTVPKSHISRADAASEIGLNARSVC